MFEYYRKADCDRNEETDLQEMKHMSTIEEDPAEKNYTRYFNTKLCERSGKIICKEP